MRIFVTGATGYIGRPLVARLLKEGHEVLALVRDKAKARGLEKQGATLLEANLGAVETVLPSQIDAVVHLAFSMFPVSDPRTNIDDSLHLIDSVLNRGVQHFIFVSAALVYGPTDQDKPVSETHPCHPNLRFAKQKLIVEQFLQTHAETRGFPAVILRPSIVFGGEGGEFAMMVKMLGQGRLPVAGSGNQRLAFTELDDLIKAIVQCLATDLTPGETMNIGTPATIPAGSLFDRIAEALGAPRPRRIPVPLVLVLGAIIGGINALLGRTSTFNLDVARLSCFLAGPRSIDRARRLIGFVPRYPDPMVPIEQYYLAPRQTRER